MRKRKRKRDLDHPSYLPLEPRRLLACTHIVLDPGHGGSSNADDLDGSTWNGAVSSGGLLEKDLALELGQQVREALVDRGYEVSMTRDTDVNLSAADRAAVARDLVTDDTEHLFFLSLHFNQSEEGIRGTETYYSDNPTAENFNLDQDRLYSGIVQKSMMAALSKFRGRDRGIQSDSISPETPLGVLADNNLGNTADRQAVLAALAEVEYIDNSRVDAILSDSVERTEFFEEIARALAAGMDTAQRTFCEQADVVQVLDRSTSMASDGKIEAVKTAASRLVDSLEHGGGIGAVSYASEASLDYELTEITDQGVRDEAIAAINAIEPDGFTAIGEGVRLADVELDRFPDHSNRVMIVLTDGNNNVSQDPISVVNEEVDQDIRIFTIGVGEGVDSFPLTAIADMRDGEFFTAISAADLNRISQVINGRISGSTTVLDSDATISPVNDLHFALSIDPSASSLTVGLVWTENDLDIELVSPSGKVYSRESITDDPDATLHFGIEYETLKINLPESGDWTAKVLGAGAAEEGTPFDLLIQSNSLLKVTTSVSNEMSEKATRFETGEKATFSVKVEDERAVTGLRVIAKVKAPSGTVTRISLVDDATQGDEVAGDGIYTAEFDELSTAGSYEIDYEMSGESSFQFLFRAFDRTQILAFGEDVLPTTEPRVTNVFSRAESIGGASPNEEALLIVRFVDPDLNETYSATIDWGDNVRETFSVQDIGNRYEFRGRHAYATAGRFEVNITISDGDKTTTATTLLYVSGVNLSGDTVFVVGGEGADVIKLFDRGDVLEVFTALEGQNSSTERFNQSEVSRVRVYSGNGDDTVTSQSESIPLEAWLGDGNDRAVGSFVNDFIRGEAGSDVIYGREGNDHINAGLGENQVFGGLGDDVLAGGDDRDLLYGGFGNDAIYGFGGDDRMYGQEGDDRILAGSGNDEVFGGDGGDAIRGSLGMDRLVGGLGDDRLFGNEDSDELFGSPGNDFLDGGPGLDKLFGGPGDDEEING